MEASAPRGALEPVACHMPCPLPRSAQEARDLLPLRQKGAAFEASKLFRPQVCIEFVFYLLMGLAGYVSFRDHTEQDFILNYRNDDMTMFAVRRPLRDGVCPLTIRVEVENPRFSIGFPY